MMRPGLSLTLVKTPCEKPSSYVDVFGFKSRDAICEFAKFSMRVRHHVTVAPASDESELDDDAIRSKSQRLLPR
jgi:hypothetical protein